MQNAYGGMFGENFMNTDISGRGSVYGVTMRDTLLDQLEEYYLVEANAEELNSYLEPDETSDNTTYQTVNIHSDITHILWGDLAPQISGETEWSLKESNTVYL